MHETDSPEAAEDQIRRTRELPIMKAIPETTRMQRPPKYHLRFRVLSTDSGHHSRPNGRIDYIDHGVSCIAWENRHRVRIPQNMVEEFKEDPVTVQSTARARVSKVPNTHPDTSFLEHLQTPASISHLATRGSRLASDYRPN